MLSAHQYDVEHTDAFEFPINTVPDWQKKFKQDKPRPFSPKDRRVLEMWSKILLALGKIEPSLATHCCKAFVVRKDGKEDRVVFDFRPLNSVIISYELPFTSMREIFDRLRRKVVHNTGYD